MKQFQSAMYLFVVEFGMVDRVVFDSFDCMVVVVVVADMTVQTSSFLNIRKQ